MGLELWDHNRVKRHNRMQMREHPAGVGSQGRRSHEQVLNWHTYLFFWNARDKFDYGLSTASRARGRDRHGCV